MLFLTQHPGFLTISVDRVVLSHGQFRPLTSFPGGLDSYLKRTMCLSNVNTLCSLLKAGFQKSNLMLDLVFTKHLLTDLWYIPDYF